MFHHDFKRAFPSSWLGPSEIAKTHPIVKFTRNGIVFARNSLAEYAAYLKRKPGEKSVKRFLKGEKFYLRELKPSHEEMAQELNEHLQIHKRDGELVFHLHGREIGTAVVDKLDGKPEVFELIANNLYICTF